MQFKLASPVVNQNQQVIAVNYTFLADLKMINIKSETNPQVQQMQYDLASSVGLELTPTQNAKAFGWDPEDRFGRKICSDALLAENGEASFNLRRVNPILKAVNRKLVCYQVQPLNYIYYDLNKSRFTTFSHPISQLPDWIIDELHEPVRGQFVKSIELT